MLSLHRLYNTCQDFESWMEDKENILNTFSPDADNMGVVQAKYEVKMSITVNLHVEGLSGSSSFINLFSIPQELPYWVGEWAEPVG